MTIRFEVCPYHEPHPAGFERTLVVDEFTRKFKCAACDAEGFLDAEDQLPKFPQLYMAPCDPQSLPEQLSQRSISDRLFSKEKDDAKA